MNAAESICKSTNIVPVGALKGSSRKQKVASLKRIATKTLAWERVTHKKAFVMKKQCSLHLANNFRTAVRMRILVTGVQTEFNYSGYIWCDPTWNYCQTCHTNHVCLSWILTHDVNRKQTWAAKANQQVTEFTGQLREGPKVTEVMRLQCALDIESTWHRSHNCSYWLMLVIRCCHCIWPICVTLEKYKIGQLPR